MSLLTLDNPQPFCVDKDAEAFVLITTALGEEKRVIRKLRQLDALKEAHTVHGSYDILARFSTKNYECLRKLLGIEIKKIEGVRATRNLLIP
jgi:DNA-binding Lrp family transcriptional regulator